MRILHGNERMDQLKSMFDLAMQSMVLYRSDTFWAYKPTHLDYLEDYISAKLREQRMQLSHVT